VHHIRPYLGLILYSLAGAAAGTGSALLWLHLLRPYRLPWWAVDLIAGAFSLVLLWLLAAVQIGRPRRPARRRAHARPCPDTRKATR
jgi:hypothetical protein